MIPSCAFEPRRTLPKLRPLTKAHQKRRGKISGRTIVNLHPEEIKNRRTGPITIKGGNTYALSVTCRICVNKLTPVELGVGQGVKWRSAFQCGLLCTLESRDIRSTLWGPQRLSRSFHSWLASMQSASEKNLDRASAKFSLDGTWHNVCPIFERSDKSKMDLITAVRAALRLPWFFQAWTRVRLSVWVSTRQLDSDWAAAERVIRSARAS